MTAADCAPPATAFPPILFRGAPLRAEKRFVGGTHRTVAPEETLERIRPAFAAAGLTRLADVTGLDRIGIPTAIGYRPNSPTLSNSAGKGFTLAAALVSGAMESLEMYHAENVRLPVTQQPYDELPAASAVARDRMVLTKASLFRAHRPEFWIEGWDIAGQRAVSVPYGSVSMIPHPRQRPALWMPFPMGSNGLASGNHLLEAACAALLEVIERDAIACHVTARRRVAHRLPRVDPDSVTLPLALDLLDRFRAAGIGTILYDLTVDTGVPVYMATIYDRLNRHVGMYSGYGAHLDPEIAMIRALTEAAQSRLTYIAGSRDDFFRHDYLRHRINDSESGVDALEANLATVDVSGVSSGATASFEGDIGVLVDRLRGCGVDQVILVDLTHEELGIPVVRVVVPGLEAYPHQLHFTPGRRALAFIDARSERL